MIRALIFIMCVLLSAGCVSAKNVKANDGLLQEKAYASVSATSRNKPSFAAATAGKAGFGLIGAAAIISAGNTIIRENGIEDPAIRIGDELIAALSRKWGISSIARSAHITDTTKPEILAVEYPDNDLLLDVQTINWSFVYFPTDWNNYRVTYSVKVRLIDTRKRKLLAEGFCSRIPEKTADAPSRDALLADKATRLKAELALAADKCIPELASNVLGIEEVQASVL